MLITVYIPTKNRLALLKRAIESVKRQDYNQIELIVVDDCSNDGTREFLIQSQDSGQLRALFPGKPMGACRARNAAILESNGYFLTGLDDDDYYTRSDKISSYVSAWDASNKNLAGLFDSAMLKTINGQYLRSAMPSAGYRELLSSNCIGNQIFAPRAHFIDAGLFDPDMPAWQDWDLWIRISKRYGVFKNISLCGTVIDETHCSDRISAKDEGVIREAMRRLAMKLSPLSFKEKSHLISSLHAYPQVKPRLIEIMTLIAALRLRASLSSVRKFLDMKSQKSSGC